MIGIDDEKDSSEHRLTAVLRSLQYPLAAVSSFLIPIKLTFGYIGLIPLLLNWLALNYRILPEKISSAPISAKTIVAFFLVAALTSLFGINRYNTAVHLGTLFFFPLSIFCFRDIVVQRGAEPICRYLVYGTVVATVLRLFSFHFPDIETKCIGAVSQSGQLTLILFLAWYYGWDYLQRSLAGILLFLFPVMALIVNEKRGPWLGCALGFALIIGRNQWKKSLLFLFFVAITIAIVPPLRDRAGASIAHFFISGGRNEIWQIGWELLLKYPLGIGFDGSGLLRDYSSEVPKNLKHFHSNYLNIAVETGWLGLFIFLQFLTTLGRELKKYLSEFPHNNLFLALSGRFSRMVDCRSG